MMKVLALESFTIDLPFRFAFKHSLASRNCSQNVIVRVTAEDSATGRRLCGYGESIPRDYVTGETAAGALEQIRKNYSPLVLQKSFDNSGVLLGSLENIWNELGLSGKSTGASFCAFELALLDAFARCHDTSVHSMFSNGKSVPDRVRFGGVIPFGGRKALHAVLWFYKVFGFETVKIKVGTDSESDIEKIKIARKIMGPQAKLRVDANCAWSRDETQRFAELARPYGLVSIEQPVPADAFEDLAYLTKQLPEQIMADESLSSLEGASFLAKENICSAFNIRLSKIGGMNAALKVARIAREAGIACHMGAQVGESGILSAAGRNFAALEQPLDNCEGNNNFFLLKRDLTKECMNVLPGGWAEVPRASSSTAASRAAPGLGVTVLEEHLEKCRSTSGDSFSSGNDRKSKNEVVSRV
jgi:L-Ala-D/L-Glu epimerase